MPIRPENRDRYPANWRQISDRIRFERASGRCECDGRCGTDHSGRCTARHGQPHPSNGKTTVLTCAHLDHTPENCDDDNLAAWCASCHLRHDRSHHAETRARARRAAIEAAGQLALSIGPAAHGGQP